MLFSRQLPLSSLIELCRTLRHYLKAGLHLPEIFQQQARRGPQPLRPIAGRLAMSLEEGQSLKQALKKESQHFPPLFLALAGIGEETGNLPEVFYELEKFYTRRQQLRRDFSRRISWPVIQLILAILALTALIFVLGMLPQQGPKRYDPLGLGLFGASGALIFLSVVVGGFAALVAGFWLLRRLLQTKPWFDSFLLAVPVLGPCLRVQALARFCLALRLTTETGMSILDAMRLSLRATGNNAFSVWAGRIRSGLREGQELTTSLAVCHLFPEEFLAVIVVAEESGQLAEVLKHQGDHYDEEAGRKLATLTALAGYLVWLLIGGVIIFAIFRLFGFYVGTINKQFTP